MVARMKSRVLAREEKVFGAVDFKRLMFAGMGTGIVWAVVRAMNLGVLSIPVILFAFSFFIWISGNRMGMPRYRGMYLAWQGGVLVAARRNPSGLSAWLSRLLTWQDDETVLNGSALFAQSGVVVDVHMEGLEILDTDDLGAGGFEIIPDDMIVFEVE